MLATGSDAAMNVVVGAAVLLGPLLAVAIYWVGIRHARRHDRQDHPSPRGPS
jgi:hypothetical protein